MIKINGITYQGNSVSILNGKVFVDGKLQTGESLSGVVKVEVTGTLDNLNCDAEVTVHGNVIGAVKAGGSVNCNNVEGGVDAGGSVKCGDVNGDVDAGGSVTCGTVSGDIDAGGSVRHG